MPTCFSSLWRHIRRSPHNSRKMRSATSTDGQLTPPGFFYVQHNSPYLRQGEIIKDLFELKLQIPEGTTINVNQGVKFDPIIHPCVIVISQDCDIEHDYKARAHEVPEDKLLTNLLFCALFSEEEVRRRSNIKSDLWKRVRQNQDERYHYLDKAPIRDTDKSLPVLIADFKTTFSLPVEFVYWLVSTSQATRSGGLISPYLEDFMHRAYNFLGRVATPPMTQ